MRYDPLAVQNLVARLGRRATFALIFWPIVGLVGGAWAGDEIGGRLAVLVCAAVGAYLGYLLGSMRAFHYRVQAQTLLWQKEVEEHVRPG